MTTKTEHDHKMITQIVEPPISVGLDVLDLVEDYCKRYPVAGEPLDVFRKLGQGVGLALSFCDGKVVGFSLLHAVGTYCLLDHTYIKPGLDLYDSGFAKIEEWAKDKGFSGLLTERVAGKRTDAYYEKRLKKCGFSPHFVSFIKEFDNGRR